MPRKVDNGLYTEDSFRLDWALGQIPPQLDGDDMSLAIKQKTDYMQTLCIVKGMLRLVVNSRIPMHW